MKYRRAKQSLALACAWTMLATPMPPAQAQTTDRAQDIDVYALPVSGDFGPNVLLILDNTANWGNTAPDCPTSYTVPNTSPPVTLNLLTGANIKTGKGGDVEQGRKIGVEKCALYAVFASLGLQDLSQFNLGMMLYNESPGYSGYPRRQFQRIDTEAKRTAFLTMIGNFHVQNDRGNNASLGHAFIDAYRWFMSASVHKGALMSARTDAGGVTYPDPTAFTNPSRTNYVGPTPGNCGTNHIIYIANGGPEGAQNDEALDKLKEVDPDQGNTPDAIGLGTDFAGVLNSDRNNWADEWARFLNKKADVDPTRDGRQNVTVHTISVTEGSGNPAYVAYMNWVAEQGGGSYTAASDVNSVVSAVQAILNKIKAAPSAFASASLPLSANTQGAYLNQVFIGMFQPDANALNRWAGNVKQYKFSYNQAANSLFLADSLNNPAVIEGDSSGFIAQSAVSYWSASSSFWANSPKFSDFGASDTPDGPHVERGAAAQRLRLRFGADQSTRSIYTGSCGGLCAGTDGLDLTASAQQFNTTNITASAVGAATDAARDALVNWVRGTDNVAYSATTTKTVSEDQYGPGPTTTPATTIRPAVHGDVLHSRPVAVNYAAANQPPQVVLFYGGNDGILRAVNGNQTGPQFSLNGGDELWGFIAPEHYSKLNRLRTNEPPIRFPATADAAPAAEKDYFFDGPIGLYQKLADNETFIFVGMRRGGTGVYALNVSYPAAPKLMWNISASSTGTGYDYSLLGDTWSMAKVAQVKRTTASMTTDPVIIMGGGLDSAAEDPATAGTTTRGNRIYVINMRTGAKLAELGAGVISHSVPGDVALVDSNNDGYIDRGYFNDARGGVYRLDIESGLAAPNDVREPSAWVVTKIADIGDWGSGGAKRKTFYPPDVVVTRDFTALLLGTGDREKPQSSESQNVVVPPAASASTRSKDRFYFIKDRKEKGEPTTVSLITDADLVHMGPATNAASDAQGCYLSMPDAGEKIVNQPVTFGGVTYFSTNRPLSTVTNQCRFSISKAYAAPLFCTTNGLVSNEFSGDGLPPSPVTGFVVIEVTNADGTTSERLVPFVIGGPQSTSPVGGGRPSFSIPATRKRTYWYMENRDR